MRTIDEAIKHCEEVAEENEKQAKLWEDGANYFNGEQIRYSRCLSRASEHRQLAEWLKELKELRKFIPNRVHPSCAECIYLKEEFEKQPCRNCCNNYSSRFEREVKADEN